MEKNFSVLNIRFFFPPFLAHDPWNVYFYGTTDGINTTEAHFCERTDKVKWKSVKNNHIPEAVTGQLNIP